MHRIIALSKKLSLTLLALVISSWTALPLTTVVYADTGSTCTPPPSSDTGNGVRWPVGADAATFTYQCTGTYAGKWTNAYYVYDPTTNTRSPLYSLDYAYDCTSGIWSRVDWEYSPSAAIYQQSRISTSDPGLPTDCPTPLPDQSSPATNSVNTAPSTASGTGTASSNDINTSATSNDTTHNTTGATIGNTSSSYADTGNAAVLNNTAGGAATSGNATDIANVANLLQSTSNVFGPSTVVFTADINGDVNGNILLDPSTILNTGPNSNNSASGNIQLNTSDTNSTDASINNNVSVNANSGNATVANNTAGGNATSGNAEAIANLMNVINSTVEAGKSFIGTINVNGNLNGDILLPQGLINQLLASTGPGSNNSATGNFTDTSTAANNVTEAVNNTLSSNATSGNASVANNTTGGNATSGNTATNVTLLNLTGSNVVAANDLLVFVNVLGKWYGMILNAPAGTTAAEIGGSITQSGPLSNNLLGASAVINKSTVNNANLAINNNVNVTAHSGNATVADNTTGGNATSGNAATAINLLNIEGSNLSLSNWFGVLFINVFGIWNGSFGIAPPSDIATSSTTPANANIPENAIQENTQQALRASLSRFATFIASGPNTATDGSSATANQSGVLGDYTAAPAAKELPKEMPSFSATTTDSAHSTYLPVVGIVIAVFFLAISEHERLLHRNRN